MRRGILLLRLAAALVSRPVGAVALSEPTLPRVGMAYHYHPYPDPYGRSMRQVAARRGLVLDPRVDGYASTPWCQHLGQYVRVQIASKRLILQQVDCSDPADLDYQVRVLDDVVEIDHSLAVQLGFAIYGGYHGDGKARTILYGWSTHFGPIEEQRH